MAKTAKKTTTSRTHAKRAGTPVTQAPRRLRAARARPSAKDLDIRDRLKVGPRRQAGPPLAGATHPTLAAKAFREEVLPPPTNPTTGRSTTSRSSKKR